MSDDLAEAVEEAAKVICKANHDRPQSCSFDGTVARVALEAARPHMPETKALERVRAVCAAEWLAKPTGREDEDGYTSLIVEPFIEHKCARAILRALEGDTPDHDDESAICGGGE